MSPTEVVIYTDGGADPNPGFGGWGAVLVDPQTGETKELSGGADMATNNRMELTAAIEALSELHEPCRVELYTDSTYLRSGITRWVPGWKRRGWKRPDGRPVLNVDLWQRLEEAAGRHRVVWRWVKGHAGNELNERADELATAEIRRRRGDDGARDAEADEESGSNRRVFLKVTHSPAGSAWAALIRDGDEETIRCERTDSDTANRCELEAAIEVVSGLAAAHLWVVYTGSEYLKNGASRWMAGWKKRRWRTREGGAVKNDDLWRRLDRVLEGRDIEWQRARSGEHPEMDELARRAKERRVR